MFTQATLDFLEENRMRNDRDWFHAHKDDYKKHVLIPFAQLVEKLAPAMLDIDGFFLVESKPEKAVSRIWRDVRFIRDKYIFRETAWCLFTRDKKLYKGYPAMYLEISPHRFRYGCGYYVAASSSMEQIRKLILENDSAYRAAMRAYRSQTVFHLEGESFKRNRYAEAPEDARDWLNRKSIHFVCNREDMNALFAPDLAETLLYDFYGIAPVYDFLIKAEMRARAEQRPVFDGFF